MAQWVGRSRCLPSARPELVHRVRGLLSHCSVWVSFAREKAIESVLDLDSFGFLVVVYYDAP